MTDTNARIFGQVVMGRAAPITNNDFTADELVVISQLVETAKKAGRNFVGYGDYTAIGGQASFQPAESAGSADPIYQVQTTLGRFNFENLQGGSTRVTDTYNFNPIYGDTRQDSQLTLRATMAYMLGFRPGGAGYSTIAGTDRAVRSAQGKSLKETAYNFARAYGEAYGPREDEGQGVPVEVFVRP